MSICIDKNLIEIGSLKLKEMVKYEVSYAKLWKDADRNMNGDVSASLIGIFPNVDASTTPMTQAQVQTLCSALDQSYFTMKFWDPSSNSQRSAKFYAADYKITLLNRIAGMYASVDFSVVPVSKR